MANTPKKEKTGLVIQGGELTLPQKSADKALILDGSGNITDSVTTSTELSYVNGVTSSIQTQLNATAPAADVDDLITLSGVAANSTDLGTFTGSIIPDNSDNKQALQSLETAIESLPDPMEYKGNWAASTNTPTLADGIGDNGDVYFVTDAGTVDFGSGPIAFVANDRVVYSGADSVWQKWLASDAVTSVFSRMGAVTAQSGDYNTSQVTENTNLYFTDERAQDAVGTILTDTASIDFTYNDGANTISAAVLPAGVDHNSLNNFVANKHIDHSAVSITTAANSGLSGGGDITTTRSLVVDITGTTAETSIANGDEILIYDVSATARRKMTRANFLAGIAISSPGDINETSFAAADNVSSPADVTGLAFANGVVRSFEAMVSVYVDATTPLYEEFKLSGIQKGSTWDMAYSSVGDNSQFAFTITNAGQIQYTNDPSYTGFNAATLRIRAWTTSI